MKRTKFLLLDRYSKICNCCLLLIILIISCSERERVNPLDPYNTDSDISILIIGKWSKYFEDPTGWTHTIEFQNNGKCIEIITYSDQQGEDRSVLQYSINNNNLTLKLNEQKQYVLKISINKNALTFEKLISNTDDWDIPLPVSYVKVD